MAHPLDNPVWSSLSSRHRSIALANGGALRYPAEVAPFVGIAAEDDAVEALTLVEPGESVGFLAVLPPESPAWHIEKEFECVQMVFDGGAPSHAVDPEVAALGESDLPAMLDLAALVYPAYFRPGTARLGPYFGVKREGRLCAMAGVRMALDGHQEVSAVCTHPDFRGEGLASRLTLHLVQHITGQGDRAFLHTESDNLTAQKVYQRVGFKTRCLLRYRTLRRISA